MENFEPDCLSEEADFSVAMLPPDDAFVTLSHAVSWIAFQHSVDGPRLSVALAIGRHRAASDADEDSRKDEAIANAVRRLTSLGSASAIEIRGRHFHDLDHDELEIFTERIPPLRLADYQWFDTLDDSLHRGAGLAWDHTRREPLYPPDNRHFRFVTVNRAELLRDFPPMAKDRAQSTGAAEKQCEAWLLTKFSEDGEGRKGKASFRTEALAVFGRRLSARGFDRAWAKVAEQAGRNKAGAKLKQ